MNPFLERAQHSVFHQVIGGALVATAFEDVIDPSTGVAFQRSPVASEAELDRAVAAARDAQPAWAARSWDAREALLTQLAEAIDGEVEWISALQSMEQGMPYPLSLAFTKYMVSRVRLLATMRVEGRVLIDDAARRVIEQWHPLGVVAAIAPWNGPLMLGMVKVASALIAGNTVVLKPSELTPLSTLEIARLGVGLLPDGVFNAVAGGRATGAAMVAHPGFDKISFTGSTATGIAIAKQSAAFLRPMTLELGGNDAAILLPDGSIDDLVAAAAQTGFSNCGQFCAAIKRIYAPAHLAEDVGAKLAVAADAFVLGSAFEPGVTLGPIQNKAQFDKVCAIVADAKTAGGRVLSGGTPLDRPGYFLPPTVIADLTDGTRLVDEEQFGPVIPVVAYTDLDSVIDRINAGPYGLTGSIWTTDLARGEAIAARLVVGSAAINRHAAFDPHVPFPLIKQSGMGVDYADHGIKGAMRLQAVTTVKPQA